MQSVHEAKTNIITHLFKTVNHTCTKQIQNQASYSKAVQSKPHNKIIIPVPEDEQNESFAKKTEEKVATLLAKNKAQATIVETSVTEKRNFVVKFKNFNSVFTALKI